MIVRIFKTSQPTALLSIPLLGLLLRFGIFFRNNLESVKDYRYIDFFSWITEFNTNFGILSGLISWLIVSFQAVYFNYTLDDQNILSRKNYLFGLLYITLFSYLPQFHYLSPAVLASCFLLPAFHKLLILSRQNSPYHHAFDSALLAGIASLIYFPSIVFFLLILISLIYFKPINVRVWLVCFIGLIIPYIFLSVYNLWFDYNESFWSAIQIINFETHLSNPEKQLKLFLPLLPILFIAIPKYINSRRANKVRVKNIYSLGFWIVAIGIVIPIVFAFSNPDFFLFFVLGGAIIIANYLYVETRSWLAEVNYIFLFITILYINYLL